MKSIVNRVFFFGIFRDSQILFYYTSVGEAYNQEVKSLLLGVLGQGG